MNKSKDQQACDVICRNHSARSERDLYRVCPAKLSKRELENLYFALLENNLDLKKTVHLQQDKLKVLSTKVQRMTVAQRNAAGKEKDCCSSKVLVNEQKELILDLKKANDSMNDRIRQLNMQLCSAKQFLKRSPSQTIKSARCANGCGFKNSSMSALNAKPSNVSVKMTAVSCQHIPTDNPESPKSSRTIGTETGEPDNDGEEKQCNENKCRTVMDELKQKIVNLQEELSKTHNEYSKRISKLENDVAGLHGENVRVRSSKVASEHALHQREKKAEELQGKLREAEGRISDLTMQLTIERRKVTELKTTLKLANTSSEVGKIIEKLNTLEQETPQTATDDVKLCSVCSYCSVKQDAGVCTSPRIELPSPSPKQNETRLSKSDDSGCTDLNKSTETEGDQAMEKLNQEMLQKIFELQTKLDGLRIKAAGESVKTRQTSAEIYDEELKDMNDSEKNVTKTLVIKDRPKIVVQIEELDGKPKKRNEKKTIDTLKQIKGRESDVDNSVDKAVTSSKQPDIPVAKSSDEKEEDSSSIKTDSSPTLKRQSKTETKLGVPEKSFNENKYQIPGPIPTLFSFAHKNKEKKKKLKNNKSSSNDTTFTKEPLKINEKGHVCDETHCSTNKNKASVIEEKNKDSVRNDVNGPTIKNKESKTIDSDIKINNSKIKLVDPKNETVKNTLPNKCKCDVPSTTQLPEKLEDDSVIINVRRLTKDDSEVGTIGNPKPKEETEIATVKSVDSGSKIHDTKVNIVGPKDEMTEHTLTKSCGCDVFIPRPLLENLDTDSLDINLRRLTKDDSEIATNLKDVKPKDETGLAKVKNVESGLKNPDTKLKIIDPKDETTEHTLIKSCVCDVPSKSPLLEKFNADSVDINFRSLTKDNHEIGTNVKDPKPKENTELTNVKNVDFGLKIPEAKVKIVDPKYGTTEHNCDVPSTSKTPLPAKLRADSVLLRLKRFSRDGSETGLNVNEDAKPKNEVAKVKIAPSNYESKTTVGPLIIDSKVGPDSGKEGNAESDGAKDTFLNGNIDDYELCASRVSVCLCPRAARREVSVFRTCSGTLRFLTVAAPARLRDCACAQRGDEATQVPLRRDSATYTATASEPRCGSATYTATVPEPRRQSAMRSAAVPDLRRQSAMHAVAAPQPYHDTATYTCEPDNTDHEISSLSDLSQEKDSKSPRNLSPGEEKATMTSETETRTTDYGSLSEGELPASTKDSRIRKLSFGEKATYADPLPESSSSQMEATLQAISEELARCRQLLASTRPQESNSTQCPPRPADRLALHRAAASRRLPDTCTHTAVFTLHIGTLVLSDEAILNSQYKSLILTWKFYDQSVTMTRMRTGRVVLFDFSTEYDVTFSEDFLNYMKQEEMVLVICEINKQDEPFATCSLPLRDALLHTNRRADMSLALVAGPGMSVQNGSDSLVQGDELGVLDLWCSLRTDTAVQNHITNSMCRNSTISVSKEDGRRSVSRTMDGPNTEDASEAGVSQAIAIGSHRNSRTIRRDSISWSQPTEYKQSFVEPAKGWTTNRGQPAVHTVDDYPRATAAPPHLAEVDGSEYPASVGPYHRRSTQKSSDLDHRVGFDSRWSGPQIQHRPSSFIANEVPANIRSTDQMKEALDRNVQSSPRFPIADDDSPTHSSIGSLRSLATKRQQYKLKLANNTVMNDREADSLQDLLKKERISNAVARQSVSQKPSTSYVPIRSSSKDLISEISAPSLTKKNNNTCKFMGLNKMMESSKKTVKYNDSPTCNEQLKEDLRQENCQGEQDESIDITVLWLALNEECEAMVNSNIHRLYVAYSFLGRRGAELETPESLPKPKHYADKCYFNFKKTFHLNDADLPLLGHMSRCRAGRAAADPRDCIVFSVVSEPPEDPLGLSSCEDIGYAHLYLGDILAYSAGSGGYTEVIPVRAAPRPAAVCGVLAVRVDGLHVLHRCLTLSHTTRDFTQVPLV